MPTERIFSSDTGPPGRRSRHRSGRVGRIAAYACGALLLTLAAGSAEAVQTSIGSLLRRARYALSEGETLVAAEDLRRVLADEPGSRRGLEAAYLLAHLEFASGRPNAADAALAKVERHATDAGVRAQILLTRGLLALGRIDGQAAAEHFAAVKLQERAGFAEEIATIGAAWADLVSAAPHVETEALADLCTRASLNEVRFAAGLTLARIHAAAGEPRRGVRTLRGLRKVLHATPYEDDLELALGLAQLRAERPARARTTFERLRRRFAGQARRASFPEASPLRLEDLRLSERDLAIRLASLYAQRARAQEGLLAFLALAFERDAAADAPAAIALADATEAEAEKSREGERR